MPGPVCAGGNSRLHAAWNAEATGRCCLAASPRGMRQDRRPNRRHVEKPGRPSPPRRADQRCQLAHRGPAGPSEDPRRSQPPDEPHRSKQAPTSLAQRALQVHRTWRRGENLTEARLSTELQSATCQGRCTKSKDNACEAKVAKLTRHV